MARSQYHPDYAVSPGQILEEHLEVREMSQAEFARRCGRSPKLISEIISSKAPIEPNTALQFERVLGLPAYVWLGIEQDYRLHLARVAEARKLEKCIEWARKFPVSTLRKRNVLTSSSFDVDTVSQMLTFFGVASVRAWEEGLCRKQLAFRHSPTLRSSREVVATWIRLGELEAEQVHCGLYSVSHFREALQQIRQLTSRPTTQSLIEAQELCQDSGVALVFVEGLRQAALSGAAWWMSPQKAVIQLSARYKTDDQFWFSFFHEAAHILLHSRKGFYLDEKVGVGSLDEENEANKWAADFLVPPKEWNAFIASVQFSDYDIQKFAKGQGISPGIVLGRLQHEKKVPCTLFTSLKRSLAWQTTKPEDEERSNPRHALVFSE